MLDMSDQGDRAREGTEAAGASDAERDAVISRLNQACGEGLLALEDYSARVEDAYVVRTSAELDRLVEDLPPGEPASRAIKTEWHVSPVGGIRRHGRWQMDRHLVSLTVLGGANLDLREAELTAPEVTLTKVSLLGGVTLCVPRGVRVVVEGFSLLGGRDIEVAEPAGPGAPTLRVRSFSVVGGITVQVPPPRHATAG